MTMLSSWSRFHLDENAGTAAGTAWTVCRWSTDAAGWSAFVLCSRQHCDPPHGHADVSSHLPVMHTTATLEN